MRDQLQYDLERLEKESKEQSSFTSHPQSQTPQAALAALKRKFPNYDVGQTIIAESPWRCSRDQCLMPSRQEPSGTAMVIYTPADIFAPRGTEHPKCRVHTIGEETGFWLGEK
jgi:hypothetical protein